MNLSSIIASIMRAIASAGKFVLKAGKWVYERGQPIVVGLAQIPFSLAGRVLAPRATPAEAAAAHMQSQAQSNKSDSDKNLKAVRDLLQQAKDRKAARGGREPMTGLVIAKAAKSYATAVLGNIKPLPDVSHIPERERTWIELLKTNRDDALAVASSTWLEISEHIAGVVTQVSMPMLPTEEWLADARKGHAIASDAIARGQKIRVSKDHEWLFEDTSAVKFV